MLRLHAYSFNGAVSKKVKRMKLDLYTSYFNARDPKRAEELKRSILTNCKSGLFRKVYVIHDAKTVKDFDHEVLEWVFLEWRPHYSDFFNIINFKTEDDTINCMGNTDIIFDPSIKFLEHIDLNDTIVELSRYERDGRIKNTGEDIWIWKGKIKPQVWGNLPLGELGCDWRITYEFRKAGYRVVNPSLDILTWHEHDSNIRYYAQQNRWFNDYDNHTPPTKIMLI